MSTRDEHMDIYDAYQMGTLSEAEKQAFEKKLAEDEALKQDFERYKQEVALIGSLGIREEMKELMESKVEKKRNLKLFIPLGVAAALAIILLVLPKKALDNESLFRQHFDAYPNAVSIRDTPGDMSTAMNYYDRGEYAEALVVFERQPDTDAVFFYKSICQLALNSPMEALENLSSIDDQSGFYNASVWYKALGFLLLDMPDSTRFYLEHSDLEKRHQDAAEKILDWTLK